MDFLFEVKETIVFSVCSKLSKTGFNFYLDLLKPKLWRFERKLVYFRAQKATVNNPNHSDWRLKIYYFADLIKKNATKEKTMSIKEKRCRRKT